MIAKKKEEQKQTREIKFIAEEPGWDLNPWGLALEIRTLMRQ
jgi:hypothetical protein